MVYEKKCWSFDSEILDIQDNCYLFGYWQSDLYFKNIREEILQSFHFPKFKENSQNEKVSRRLKDCRSVSVHIRRGDYLKVAATLCSISYYEKAITLMKEKVNPELFVIFSDDIAWCKEHFGNLIGASETLYVDWNKGKESFRDMQLMSLCQHNIIANSSFSWWGAWLNQNPNKIVMCPSRWMPHGTQPDVLPSDWIKIDPDYQLES